jgi:hypothetical protein
MKRQIKGAELARTLCKTLSYLSMKDFKWVIQSNQIKDCPVTFQDIDVALKIWGKNIAALQGKTTRIKTIPVGRDCVKVPLELTKLHREVFLTTFIFFVNKNPFFLTLSRNITFTAVNHLEEPHGAENIQGFQGDLSLLSRTWFSHHSGARRRRIHTPEAFD